MTAPRRLAAFAVLLAAVFVASLLLGAAAGPDPSPSPPGSGSDHDHPLGDG